MNCSSDRILFHFSQEQLSPSEIFSNVFIVLVAGYETTSTALGYCTHRLALHRDIQEKLYEELIEHWSGDTDSYDVIMTKLSYMDSFVREVLRMHPIALQVVNRQCAENTHVAGYDIQKGFSLNIAIAERVIYFVFLPSGSSIQVDVLSVHYNQELWGPEPVDEFHPERHFDKRHPLAYMPFGAGPRTCIGMRFALSKFDLLEFSPSYFGNSSGN